MNSIVYVCLIILLTDDVITQYNYFNKLCTKEYFYKNNIYALEPLLINTAPRITYELGDKWSIFVRILVNTATITRTELYGHTGLIYKDFSCTHGNRCEGYFNYQLNEPRLDIFMHLLREEQLCAVIHFVEAVNVKTISTNPVKSSHVKCITVEADIGNKCNDFDMVRYLHVGDHFDIECDLHAEPYERNIWFQVNSDNKTINAAPWMKKGLRNVLSFTAELFDHNTVFRCIYESKTQTNIPRTQTNNMDIPIRITRRRVYLRLLDLDPNEKRGVEYTLRYTDKKQVKFSCEQYLGISDEVQVALVYTNNKMDTFSVVTFTDDTFTAAMNGTMICCICYVMTYVDETSYIKRHVLKKTLLLYESGIVNGTDFIDSLITCMWVVVGIVTFLSLLATIILSIKNCYTKGEPGNSQAQVTGPSLATESQGLGPNPNPFYLNELSHLRADCDRKIEEQEHYYEEID